MKRLTKFINSNISGKKVLMLFVLTNVVYAFMLTTTIPKTTKFANGMKLLDMMPTEYNLNYVNSLFNSLGENGRNTYLTNQIPVDMIYPFLFGLSYCLLLAFFLKKINKLKPPLSYLCLLPIITAIADYLENLGIIIMLNSYPKLAESTINICNVFSVVKSTSTSLFFIILLVVIITLGFKTMSKKLQANSN